MKLVEPEEPKDSTRPNGVVAQEQPPEEDDDNDEWKVVTELRIGYTFVNYLTKQYFEL